MKSSNVDAAVDALESLGAELKRSKSGKVLSVDLRPMADRVSDSDLRHLQSLTALREIYLDGAPVSDAGLVHILGLTKLATLDLQHTCVTDVGLSGLKRNQSIKLLLLTGSRVTREVVKETRKSMLNTRIVFVESLP